VKDENVKVWAKSIKGAIFWIVESTQQLNQEEAFMTDGNQKCMGAIPNFIARSKIRNEEALIIFSLLLKIVNSKRPDGIPWANRYFIAASFSCWILLYIINGMNENILHSSPVHTIYHLVALIIKITLRRVPVKNTKFVKDKIIRSIETEKESNLFHIWFRIPISRPVVSNYFTQSREPSCHSWRSPSNKIIHTGQDRKIIDAIVLDVTINGMGSRNVISISNTKNTIVSKKNRREKADRDVFFESKPHSKGLSFSRSEWARIAINRAMITRRAETKNDKITT